MSIRTAIANKFIDFGRRLGRKPGSSEMKVTVSDHSLSVEMVDIEKDTYAWDSDLFKYGNLYLSGYSNPIKPSVDRNKELEDPDEAKLHVDGETLEPGEDQHAQLISSSRYREYMRQDLISQLLNPRAQWKLIAYAVIGLAGLVLMNLLVSLSAAGVL